MRSARATFTAHLGSRIQELRRSLGRDRRDVAAAANVTLEQLKKYENGLAEPPVRVLARLARALGVLVDVLLQEPGREPATVDELLLDRLSKVSRLNPRAKEAAVGALDVLLGLEQFSAHPNLPSSGPKRP